MNNKEKKIKISKPVRDSSLNGTRGIKNVFLLLLILPLLWGWGCKSKDTNQNQQQNQQGQQQGQTDEPFEVPKERVDILMLNCTSGGDDGCCLRSVEVITEGSFELSDNGACAEGYVVKNLDCEGGYSWCQPK
ncbi:hypothetical protein KKH39_03105 [Patescibacteria group bacterium]|nr:hypothetical protein [Patescibacteria group bacterium]